MPRLDKTNPLVEEYFGYEFNEEDPGATEEIDLCDECFDVLDFHDRSDCPDAPEYEGWEYYCAGCSRLLDQEDD